MHALVQVVRRYPVAAFFVVAYALSWIAVVPAQGVLLPWGPAVAALIIATLTDGKSGVRVILRQMGRWRVGLIWYVVAFALPLITSLGAAGLNVLLGGRAGQFEPWYNFFLLIPIFLVIGGQWEEPGWTGYALPRLQANRSALAASLILSVFRIG